MQFAVNKIVKLTFFAICEHLNISNMSSPNARICNTPNCRCLATKTVAGIGEWCQTCYSSYFPIPSIYQTHSNLPSIYHFNNLRNIRIPQVPPSINIPGVPPPIQIPQMPPHIHFPKCSKWQIQTLILFQIISFQHPLPNTSLGLQLRVVRFYGGRRKGESKYNKIDSTQRSFLMSLRIQPPLHHLFSNPSSMCHAHL